MAAIRVLFLGMRGHFSRPPLEALIAAGVRVVGVWLPGEGGPHLASPSPTRTANLVGEELPVLNRYVEHNIVHVAWDHGIPVYEVGDLKSMETLELARSMRPDVLAMACFDRLVPRELRELARLSVNVHPSLLPENRGPAPLYWTFKLGLTKTGVTIHMLEERADAGPILAQREMPVPEGIGEAELEQQLAKLGGKLLVEVVQQFAAGSLLPQPQDESRATTYPWPT